MVVKLNNIELKKISEKCGTPVYVYLEDTLINNVKRIKEAIAKSGLKNKVKINVSYFANSNPHIIKILSKLGLGITIQCPEENEHLKKFGMEKIERAVAPTHLSKEDLEYFLDHGLKINFGTFSNIIEALKKDLDKINIRIDLSPESQQRQGIKPAQFEELKVLLSKYGKKLHGIHIYPGTRSDLDIHLRYQIKALQFVQSFPNIKEINLGGGFNFDYEGESRNPHFDWTSYFKELKKNVDEFQINEEIEFIIEPGRDILADAGFLLVKVNGVERIFGKELFEIFTDCSYVHIPSATIRSRQHKLSFFDNTFKRKVTSKMNEGSGLLSGNTTLSSDRLFSRAIYFPLSLKDGDYLLLHDVGAYGATQHMEFLNKAPSPEVIIRSDNRIQLLTKKGLPTDKIRNLLPDPLNLEDVE